eukprot:7920621-Karenia_brevis.AAC.1
MNAALVKKPDGKLTGNAVEVDELLHKSWDPIFRMYASVPEPAWEPFFERYSRYIHRHPMTVERLTGERLRSVLLKMRAASSSGADGWRVSELRKLPDVLLDRLAEVFNMIEERGVWPVSLERAVVSLIPKTDSTEPGDLRPISVMSVIYRLWACARLQEVMAWQEKWAARSQHGARSGHGTEN